jgi:hypothetical protein
MNVSVHSEHALAIRTHLAILGRVFFGNDLAVIFAVRADVPVFRLAASREPNRLLPATFVLALL